MIKILILAPSLALRTGLQALLTADEAYSVLASVGSLADVPDMDAPDVLVAVPQALTEDALADYLAQQTTPPAILLLSDEGADALLFKEQALRAWGILPLDVTEDELYLVVEVLAQGLTVGDPALFQSLLGGVATDEAAPNLEVLVHDLTPRELEVLALLAEGFANKQIALELAISEHTVKFHVSSIYTKLGVANRAEAVRAAARAGLIIL